MLPVAFFGELYLRSTLPFLSAEVTRLEAQLLISQFSGLTTQGAVIDIGCGHGRHLSQVAPALDRPVFGVDLDPMSLEQAQLPRRLVRADFFELPFKSASLGGAYSWYNTLFTFDDEAQARVLRELHRVVKPKGLLIVQGQPTGRIASLPDVDSDQTLPDGSRLQERCTYNQKTGRDEATRVLTSPDGRAITASFFIRYYSPEELTALLESAGWGVEWLWGGLDGAPPTDESTELIVGAYRT